MRGLCLAILVPTLLLAPLAHADTHGEAHDPDNVTAISAYMETVAKGIERLNAKEYTVAIDTLRRAIQLAPRNPLAPYLLAEIYVLRNNLGEADAAIAQAREGDRIKSPPTYAKVLFFSADLAEREKKWDDALLYWQTYADFVAKNPAGPASPNAAARLAAAQKRAEMEKAYAGVRARIAGDREPKK